MIPMTLDQVARAAGGEVDPAWGYRTVHRVERSSGDVQPGDLFVALKGVRFDGHDFLAEARMRGATAALVSRGGRAAVGTPAPLPLIAVEDTYQALARLAAWYRHHVMDVSTTVVAVTGSNGKTTTKRMLDHVLAAALPGRASPASYNNRVGVPLTLLSAQRGDRYLICEVGTSAAGEIAALSEIIAPDVAVITSIGEAHLEGLGSLEGVAAEKFSMVPFVRPGGVAVVHGDSPELHRHVARTARPRVVTFGIGVSSRLRVENVEIHADGTTCVLEGRFPVALPLPGAHHASNAAAVFAVARWMGVAPETILARLAGFQALPGRAARELLSGLTLIDDAYNANPASMRAAVETLRALGRGRRVMVAGDMMELGAGCEAWHCAFVDQVGQSGIEFLVTVGAHMARALADRTESGVRMQATACDDAAAAVDVLAKFLRPGDTVWVKGSRAVGLERVVKALRSAWSPRAAVA